MPCVAEFGIIDKFDQHKDYSRYEPEKYGCVAIHDDFLDDWWGELESLKTYFHSYSRPSSALARFGITLIPPESLDAFYNIVASDPRADQSSELIALMTLLKKAKDEGNYVIHYGV